MTSDSPLKTNPYWPVDNEPDILETMEEKLDICIIRKATDYETAMQYLVGFIFDIVIFDIMSVNWFELLKDATAKDLHETIAKDLNDRYVLK